MQHLLCPDRSLMQPRSAFLADCSCWPAPGWLSDGQISGSCQEHQHLAVSGRFPRDRPRPGAHLQHTRHPGWAGADGRFIQKGKHLRRRGTCDADSVLGSPTPGIKPHGHGGRGMPANACRCISSMWRFTTGQCSWRPGAQLQAQRCAMTPSLSWSLMQCAMCPATASMDLHADAPHPCEGQSCSWQSATARQGAWG